MCKRCNKRKIQVPAMALALMLFAARTSAGTVDVTVFDADGAPVADVVVYAVGEADAKLALTTQSAVMDQIDTRFVPHILVVRTGTAVEFPNSDIVAHHVYSFSKPNDFVLPLYKGDPHNPVRFDHDGIVILGCNIHDQMLGYIVVVASSSFGKTDASGKVQLEINSASGDQTLKIWSPRIRDKSSSLVQTVSVNATGTQQVRFALQKKLRPAHDPGREAEQWSEY